MDPLWRHSLWQQFGAAIDMLDAALLACPDELWRAPLWDDPASPEFAQFWVVAQHALFWLDLYLSGAVEGFAPPAPFTLDELNPAGVIPARTYTREEMRGYLAHCRGKCRATIEGLTDEEAGRRCVFGWGEVSFLELLLYNLRHVQEHAAQMNLLLGQRTGSAPGWVTAADRRRDAG